jgi:hypothetical protein
MSSVQEIVENVFPEILNNYEIINGFVNEPYWQIIIFLYTAIISFSSSFIYRISSNAGYFS